MNDIFRLADDLGPAKVIHVQEPAIGLKAVLVTDMGTDETCMAWVKDEIGRSVGLPAEIGGIPLDEFGATGWGILQCAEVAAQFARLKLGGARVAVQGFRRRARTWCARTTSGD